MKVRIGIHVHAEPERFAATLASVQAHSPEMTECVLLPDGPDAATAAALAAIGNLEKSSTEEPLGPPACFNRLTSAGEADIFVLVESGVIVGPAWLTLLLAALNADSRNGLTGPSTNRSWNEQAAFAGAGGTPEEVRATAEEALRRFGSAVRNLEPLYSLADFCYAARRDVVQTVGPADEGYGFGPCWEMDYNVRAARAGFRGVWACGAYVYRTAFTARREREEARLFEASKRRYQDKFCGRRLQGQRGAYRAHCRGDACANFAPPALLGMLGQPPSRPALGVALPVISSAASDDPLVSCIMPTFNRRRFIPLAVASFLRQNYPRAELLVVDDGTDAVADCLPQDPRIRYIRPDRRLTVGAKRNLACAQVRGDVIVHWDDDDWYPAWRLAAQVATLRDSTAEVCGSSQLFYYDAAANRSWQYRYTGQPNSWVAGNTLAYLKSYWSRNRFPDVQVGEDTRFLSSGRPHGLRDLADPSLCVAMIHAANISPKRTVGCCWQPCPEAPIRELLGLDLAAYRMASGQDAGPTAPLVSCIMPTYNRRAFLPIALGAFLGQDYPNKELLVIDDGTDPVGDVIEGKLGVRYIRLGDRASIGAKRNLACERASGEIIAHWDDDDWYASDRLRYQTAPLLTGEADITGLENAFVLELPSGQFWKTDPSLHKRMFVGDVHGGTLVYRKALLRGDLRYPDQNLAEDAALLTQALRRGQRLRKLPNPGIFVYVRHGKNAWRFQAGRFLDPAGWQPTTPPATFPTAVLAVYQAASAGRGPETVQSRCGSQV